MRDNLGNPMQAARPEFDPGVLLLDDCSGTFNWTAGGTGGDDVHAYATAAALHGTQGMHLKTRTTGAAANDVLTVTRVVGQPESALLVMRARVAVVDKTKVQAVDLKITERSAYFVSVAGLRWLASAHLLEYWTSAGAWGSVAGYQFPDSDLAWVDMEMVLDVGLRQYRHLVVNGIRTDMSGYGYAKGAGTTRRQVDVAVSVTAGTAAPAEAYCDLIYVGSYLHV